MAQATQLLTTNVVSLRTPGRAPDHHTHVGAAVERARQALELYAGAMHQADARAAEHAYFAACLEVEKLAERIWSTPARSWSDVISRAHLVKHFEPAPDDCCPVHRRATGELVSAILTLGREVR